MNNSAYWRQSAREMETAAKETRERAAPGWERVAAKLDETAAMCHRSYAEELADEIERAGWSREQWRERETYWREMVAGYETDPASPCPEARADALALAREAAEFYAHPQHPALDSLLEGVAL